MPSPPPSTMRAWSHSKPGLPSKILSLSKVPIPCITSPTDVLIRTTHCSLNPGASIIMQLLPSIFRGAPAIPEMDFSGRIVDVGTNVSQARRELSTGTRVFGSVPVGRHVKSSCGALAEYLVLDHEGVVKAPDAARLEDVAGLAIAGSTALELVRAAKLKRGDSVLVNGASGGIGHLALQMCREGVGDTGRVVAVCSSDNVGWVGEFGADEVIDYKAHDPVHSYLAETYGTSRFNVVIDAVGIQSVFDNSPGFLVEGGSYVSVGPRAQSFTFLGIFATIGLMAKNFLWPRILGGTPRNYVQVTGVANLKALEELAAMVEEGKLRVKVGTKVQFDDVQEAYAKMLSGHAQGKVVVAIHEAD